MGLEAAHSRRRIVHAGDSTGAEVMRALIAQVHATPSITLREGSAVTHLTLHDGAIAGVVLDDGTPIQAAHVVLATGGIGGLYTHTTNPRTAWGHGLLLAARAGAVLSDLEFVQFHPTALDVGLDPMPLVSEAVRGEGATLIDEHGVRFMAGPGARPGRAELEPRDVVSRAVWAHLSAGHRVFLDARAALGDQFDTHFPAIAHSCRAAGIDPACMPIPIHPAAHYHMGGIATDADGRTTLPGLYACGECASTGLHGANRLASNSLLEAAVCGAAVAAAIKATPAAPHRPAPPRMSPSRAEHPADTAQIRPIVTAGLGVLRDRAGLEHAITRLLRVADSGTAAAAPAQVALMIAVSALARTESRGAHARTDCPGRATTAQRSRTTLAQTLAQARALACVPA